MPRRPKLVFDTSIIDIDVKSINKNYKIEHRLEYRIGKNVFTYYPASIITILNDLDLELCLIKKRISHSMTLSGYEVLRMEIDSDKATLFDPTSRSGSNKIAGVFLVDELESKFQKSIIEVLNGIQ